jgi:hypothetical protein
MNPIWAWQCEHCLRWQHESRQPTAVIVREPGPEISNGGFIERLPVDRRMVICPDCVKTMRVSDG